MRDVRFARHGVAELAIELATDRTPGSGGLPPSPHDRVRRGRGPARGESQVSADLGQETSRRAKAGPLIRRAVRGCSYMPPTESGCFEPVITTTGGSHDAAGLARGDKEGARVRGHETSRGIKARPRIGRPPTSYPCPQARESRSVGLDRSGYWTADEAASPAGGDEQVAGEGRVDTCLRSRSGVLPLTALAWLRMSASGRPRRRCLDPPEACFDYRSSSARAGTLGRSFHAIAAPLRVPWETAPWGKRRSSVPALRNGGSLRENVRSQLLGSS